jgi:hypothetical protein
MGCFLSHVHGALPLSSPRGRTTQSSLFELRPAQQDSIEHQRLTTLLFGESGAMELIYGVEIAPYSV